MADDNGSTLAEFSTRPLFHFALPVADLAATRQFYVDVLGCKVGREADSWIDFNFFGYQITAHRVAEAVVPAGFSSVDGHDIPVPHFGLIMGWEDWHRAVDHLGYIGVAFKVPPHIRFKGEAGEQAAFFIEDPSGNCLEFKAFHAADDVFRRA